MKKSFKTLALGLVLILTMSIVFSPKDVSAATKTKTITLTVSAPSGLGASFRMLGDYGSAYIGKTTKVAFTYDTTTTKTGYLRVTATDALGFKRTCTIPITTSRLNSYSKLKVTFTGNSAGMTGSYYGWS